MSRENSRDQESLVKYDTPILVSTSANKAATTQTQLLKSMTFCQILMVFEKFTDLKGTILLIFGK